MRLRSFLESLRFQRILWKGTKQNGKNNVTLINVDLKSIALPFKRAVLPLVTELKLIMHIKFFFIVIKQLEKFSHSQFQFERYLIIFKYKRRIMVKIMMNFIIYAIGYGKCCGLNMNCYKNFNSWFWKQRWDVIIDVTCWKCILYITILLVYIQEWYFFNNFTSFWSIVLCRASMLAISIAKKWEILAWTIQVKVKDM